MDDKLIPRRPSRSNDDDRDSRDEIGKKITDKVAKISFFFNHIHPIPAIGISVTGIKSPESTLPGLSIVRTLIWRKYLDF